MSASRRSQESPDILLEILEELYAPPLRGVRSYIAQRLDELRSSLEELIRSEAAGDIVDIEDRGGYTLVKMYPLARDDCEASSPPLILYRVKHERKLDGEETLQWSYLGEVTERSGVDGGEPGSRPPVHETGRPPRVETSAREEER